MRSVPIGESAVLDVVVTPEMTVRFDELGPVHPVYATYTMARHFEEAGRKLLLRYLQPGEAGIGSSLSVEHLAPSRVGDAVRVTARCVELRGNRLTCECTAVDAEGRLLGRGTTGQVVMSEEALQVRIGEPVPIQQGGSGDVLRGRASGTRAGQDGGVLSVDVARALRDAGLQWTPARGDTFVIPDRGMDSDVFVLSDMTIEVHQFPAGPVIGFNGTTEWALDSIEQAQALWVPAEHQLRELLGDAFAGLAPTGDGYRVTLRVDGTTSGYDGLDPAEAYALALLHLLRSRHA